MLNEIWELHLKCNMCAFITFMRYVVGNVF